jgi:hypothetical protein
MDPVALRPQGFRQKGERDNFYLPDRWSFRERTGGEVTNKPLYGHSPRLSHRFTKFDSALARTTADGHTVTLLTIAGSGLSFAAKVSDWTGRQRTGQRTLEIT